ncbi:MAG: ATPase domain-containing protein [Thermoleophilia bacterium]
MTGRIPTGSLPLDSILSGGFPPQSINIIMGLPGTGKTILAESIIFANARPDRKALYVSTVSEPLDKIVRYAQDFDFFDPDAIQDYVMFEDLSLLLREQGFKATIARIISLLRELDAQYLVIDSFKALHAFGSSEEDFRSALYELAVGVSSLRVTSFWVGEYGSGDMHALPEFAVADGVVELVLDKQGTRDARYLRVLKMRGSDFQSGEQAYRISPKGLLVYPRLTTPAVPIVYEALSERSKTGVELLDEMLSDGYWKGSSTVVFGPPGCGKTLLCLHFIFKGIELGEKGLFITLQENPTQLARVARGFGFDLPKAIEDRKLLLKYVSPVEVNIDEVVYEAAHAADEFGAERLVLDSLNDLALAADPIRFRDYTYSFVQTMATRQISLLMTSEIKDLFASTYLSEFGVSHMSDNLILLHYLREESEVKRAITTLKTRASAHESSIRQFTIDGSGMHIGNEFLPGTVFVT